MRFFLFLFLFLSLSSAAQDLENSLKEDVYFLTDPIHEGRGFGQAGEQLQNFYLVRRFSDAGLRTFCQAFSHDGKVGHNIIGVTPGWYRKYIVVGAYIDGLGCIDGESYPGADSNASGVAALLALSSMLSGCCNGEVGIIFVGFDGHGSSMCGARDFVGRNLSEYKISLMVNLDILGSSSAPVTPGRTEYLLALGGASHRTELDRANRDLRLELCYDYYGSRNFTDLFYRNISEQKWFLDAGIKSVMFTSGITMNTNRLTDTPDTLDYPVFAKRVMLIFNWLKLQI